MATEEVKNDMSFPEAEVGECEGCCETKPIEELDDGDGFCQSCVEGSEMCEECGENEAAFGDCLCDDCRSGHSSDDEDEDEEES